MNSEMTALALGGKWVFLGNSGESVAMLEASNWSCFRRLHNAIPAMPPPSSQRKRRLDPRVIRVSSKGKGKDERRKTRDSRMTSTFRARERINPVVVPLTPGLSRVGERGTEIVFAEAFPFALALSTHGQFASIHIHKLIRVK